MRLTYDDLTPEQHLPPPWIDFAARHLFGEVNAKADAEMRLAGEDPNNQPLFLLRRRQVMIAFEAYLDHAEEHYRQ